MDFKSKKIIIFDLDGTLAESKQGLNQEISDLLFQLLDIKKVAIITGGGFLQLQKQVINKIPIDLNRLKNLYLFPTKGSVMYNFDGQNWQKIYEKSLLKEEKEEIVNAFNKIYQEVDFLPKEHFGNLLEDRNSQFTFSALGQDAPIEIKKKWDKDFTKRKELKKHLDKYLSKFAVEIGGSTSIDITHKFINKAYAIEKICEILNIKEKEILFIGDAIFEGGNDYSVIKTAVNNIGVNDFNETKKIIEKIILLSSSEGLKTTYDKRPWGLEEILTINEPSTVKILTIEPGQKTSLQYHNNRKEFWKVIEGEVIFEINNQKIEAKKSDEYNIENKAVHRLIAKDKSANILEISFGEFNENDIVRLEDDYERIK